MTILFHWILATLSLLITSRVVPGFLISSWTSAFLAAAVLGVLNALMWPLFVILTLPITILTFGLFLFVINAFILKIGAALVPGFKIEGFLPALLGGVVLALVGWVSRVLVNV